MILKIIIFLKFKKSMKTHIEFWIPVVLTKKYIAKPTFPTLVDFRKPALQKVPFTHCARSPVAKKYK